MKLKKLLKIMPTAKVKFIDNEDYCTVTLKNIPYLKMSYLKRKLGIFMPIQILSIFI